MATTQIDLLTLVWTVIAAAIGWLIVFIKILLPQFFLTKEQRIKLDIEQKKLKLDLQKQADEKMKTLNIAYQDFSSELTKWTKRKTNPSVDSFDKLTKVAEIYFNQLESIALAILDGNLSDTCIKYTLSPLIRKVVEENTIEKFYITIKDRFPAYTGIYNAENYKTIFLLDEMYCTLKNNWWNKLIAYLISVLYRLYLRKLPPKKKI